MTRKEAAEKLISLWYFLTNNDYPQKDLDALKVAIKALEQEPCDDAISRQAVDDKLLKLCNELEGIFANIRMKEVDDCVCGLCEYDCDHGIDGSAFECPGFETDECFKLADKIRHEWQSTKDLPPVNPQPKTGHWIFDEILDKHYYCSECKSMGVDYWDFCPNCGCRMVEPQESEVRND